MKPFSILFSRHLLILDPSLFLSLLIRFLYWLQLSVFSPFACPNTFTHPAVTCLIRFNKFPPNHIVLLAGYEVFFYGLCTAFDPVGSKDATGRLYLRLVGSIPSCRVPFCFPFMMPSLLH